MALIANPPRRALISVYRLYMIAPSDWRNLVVSTPFTASMCTDYLSWLILSINPADITIPSTMESGIR